MLKFDIFPTFLPFHNLVFLLLNIRQKNVAPIQFAVRELNILQDEILLKGILMVSEKIH
jgi:hypothetical protein